MRDDDSPASPSPPRDPYGPWRERDFRFYAVSWFLVIFSKQVETVAALLFLYGQTSRESALQGYLALGLVGLVQALPVFLLSIAGGQLADHFERRRVMLGTLTISSITAFGLWWFSLSGGSILWVYALLALGAVSQALGSPSRSALLPQIVAPEQLSTAITWSSSMFQLATMTGPAIGGLILGTSVAASTAASALPDVAADLARSAAARHYNAPAAFFLVLLCRVTAAVFVGLMRRRPAADHGDAVNWESLSAGVRFVARTKPILATITLDMIAVLFGGFTYLLPVFALDILHVGPSGLGFLRSAEAIGAVAMAVLLAHLPPLRRAGRSLLTAVAGYGLAVIVFGISRSYALSLSMMFLIGALDNVSVVIRHTLLQMLTPDAMRGRVSAVNTVFIVASNDIGGLESGVAAAVLGPVGSVVFGGTAAILTTIGCALKWPQILRIGALADVKPEDVQAIVEESETELAARD